MRIDQTVVLHGGDGLAAADVQPDAHRTLVQVGLAVRLMGGQPQHAHDGKALEHDQADVRHAFEADGFEGVCGLHQRLDDGHVGAAAQGVQAADGVGEVPLDVVDADQLAARLHVAVRSCGRGSPECPCRRNPEPA